MDKSVNFILKSTNRSVHFINLVKFPVKIIKFVILLLKHSRKPFDLLRKKCHFVFIFSNFCSILSTAWRLPRELLVFSAQWFYLHSKLANLIAWETEFLLAISDLSKKSFILTFQPFHIVVHTSQLLWQAFNFDARLRQVSKIPIFLLDHPGQLVNSSLQLFILITGHFKLVIELRNCVGREA